MKDAHLGEMVGELRGLTKIRHVILTDVREGIVVFFSGQVLAERLQMSRNLGPLSPTVLLWSSPRRARSLTMIGLSGASEQICACEEIKGRMHNR